uniref:RNA exonuclease NEF-sp n=1 Tax=Cacopsylla melanoneura TaxID=428564 RepID=A0A8D8S1S6_9HEMI
MNARQVQRLENKKRKMDALNEIKSLNDADRRIKRPYSIVNIKPVVKKKSKLMLYLKHQGESAQVNDTGLPQSRIPLFVSDVRDFLLYIVFNKTCPPYTEPRWCNVSKKKIDHTILLVVEGFTLNDYLKHSHQMTGLRDGFVKMEIVPPSSYATSLIHELIMSSKHEESQDVTPSSVKPQGAPTGKASLDSVVPVHTVRSAFPIRTNQNRASETRTVSCEPLTEPNTPSGGTETKFESVDQPSGPESKEKATDVESSNILESNLESSLSGAADSSPSCCLPESDKFPRTMLLLSALQMIEEDYPIPLRGELSARFSKYINTKDVYSEVTPHSPLFGLDCEMCKTGNDRTELTRVTLVDEHENVIYESLVKPYNTITNYLTPYSGITRALLDPVATRLEDAQRALIERLPSDAILVGQSLNCDLHALKMMHPYVIDTSVIFNTTGVRTHKPKLKTLASHFLGMEIQNSSDGTVGHCSKEDAIAALKLVRLKLSKDPQYGDTVALQRCIRNINSKLSCPGEVRNLCAYFDKILTKKKDTQVEKSALVLTTDKEAAVEYKRYLATYRTQCKLITGNKTTPASSDKTTPSSDNTNKAEHNPSEKWSTSSLNGKHTANDLKSVETRIAETSPHRNQFKTDNKLNDESMDTVCSEESGNSNTSNSQSKSNNCKRKISSPSIHNQISNNTTIPSLVDLAELEETSCSSPSKIKKDNRDAATGGDRRSLTNHTKVTSKLNTHTKVDNRTRSKNVKDDTKVDTSILANNVKDLIDKVNSNVVLLDEKDATINNSDNEQEERMIVKNCSKNETKSKERSEEDIRVVTSQKSGSEIPKITSNRQNPPPKTLENSQTKKSLEKSQIYKTVENSETNKTTLEDFQTLVDDDTHKQLVREILQVSPHKELVIGHTKVNDRFAALNTMVDELENGLAENQLLVVLSVPENEQDRSSGVCFVYASLNQKRIESKLRLNDVDRCTF